jgi:hypothetical protein
MIMMMPRLHSVQDHGRETPHSGPCEDEVRRERGRERINVNKYQETMIMFLIVYL